MAKFPEHLNSTFKALSDPTRRAVLERLSRGPQQMTILAEAHAMALPSFSQHLDVLEDAGLVTSLKQGRTRIYTLNTRELKTAESWLSGQRAVWETRLDQLDSYLLEMEASEKPKKSKGRKK